MPSSRGGVVRSSPALRGAAPTVLDRLLHRAGQALCPERPAWMRLCAQSLYHYLARCTRACLSTSRSLAAVSVAPVLWLGTDAVFWCRSLGRLGVPRLPDPRCYSRDEDRRCLRAHSGSADLHRRRGPGSEESLRRPCAARTSFQPHSSTTDVAAAGPAWGCRREVVPAIHRGSRHAPGHHAAGQGGHSVSDPVHAAVQQLTSAPSPAISTRRARSPLHRGRAWRSSGRRAGSARRWWR